MHFDHKWLTSSSRSGNKGSDICRYEEWYTPFSLYHYSSEYVNPGLPGTHENVGCELKLVCRTLMSKDK